MLLKKRGFLLSMIVVVLILFVSCTILSMEKKQLKESNEIKEPVVKLEEPKGLEKTVSFQEVSSILKDPRLAGATIAISVRKASDGEIMYEYFGDTRVRPASVMKLLTGAVALETLGQQHAFKTELYADGVIENGLLQGNLYLRGQGNPTLTSTELHTFALNLKRKGIHAISGHIYGDDTWFDDERLSQDLNWSDEPYHTGAQISALTFSPNEDYDAGTIIVEVSPAAKVGEAAIVRTVPATNYVTIINKTETIAKNGNHTIKVERLHGSNSIVVSGTAPLGLAKKRSWASVWEPTDYTVSLLKSTLEGQGITFTPIAQMLRGKVPNGVNLLDTNESMPLEELLIPFMKLSNNGHGEVLVKEMGRVVSGEGSWKKGLTVMNETLADLGVDTDTILLRDGSGMSHKTLVTANEVTKVLYSVQAKSWYPVFLKSLPVAGADERFVGGTLRYRMKGTTAEGNVRAKTGTLNGVASLAGYAESKDGEDLIFSIIINNHLDEKIYEVIDQIAVAITTSAELVE